MTNILILGYYHRKNFGDDLFEYCFQNFLLDDPKYQLTFLNLDDFKVLDLSTNSFDLIIIGGGDLVNEYYFNDTNIKLLQSFECPIHFVGTGISFENTLSLIDIGDHFFMRNQHDTKRLQTRYGTEYSHFIPDLGFSLGMVLEPSLFENHAMGIQKIGVSLPYTWLAGNTSYERILDNVVQTLTALAQTFEILFIPFDVSQSPSNSDLIFVQELERRTTSIQHRITYIKDTELTPEKMIGYYQQVDAIIGSRFHSIIMAILCEKPFISLYSTTKLTQLKNDFPTLQHLFIPIEKDVNLNPIKVNMNSVIFSLQALMFNYRDYVTRIQDVKKNIFVQLNNFKQTFSTLIQSGNVRSSPPTMLSEHKETEIVKKTISKVLHRIYDRVTMTDIDKVVKGQPLVNILPKALYNDNTRKVITEETLWTLCEDPYGPYYYGLYEKVFSTNFINQIRWVVRDYYQRFKVHTSNNTSMLTIINKNFQEVHRSGWQPIVNHLLVEFDKKLTSPVIVDTYIDKTFHWNKYFYTHKGIIPYTKPWIGFVHHTFNDSVNYFNCHELFKNQLFIDSLKTCKCLIVMSKCLEHEIHKTLMEKNINVPIQSVTHPTDINVIPFQWSKFMANKNRQIVQVGNWLRNMYAIYDLHLPKTSIVTQKSILKTKNSSSFFIPDDFFKSFLQNYLPNEIETSDIPTVYDICKISFQNQHIKGMYKTLIDNYKSVQCLEYLPNHQYDLLLSENIVFLNLIDASAVNTIIECIVRHTPLLINPIEPVIEMLGEKYPLYYKDAFQASTLLNDSTQILAAHAYLKEMDKTRFTLPHFSQEIEKIFEMYL